MFKNKKERALKKRSNLECELTLKFHKKFCIVGSFIIPKYVSESILGMNKINNKAFYFFNERELLFIIFFKKNLKPKYFKIL